MAGYKQCNYFSAVQGGTFLRVRIRRIGAKPWVWLILLSAAAMVFAQGPPPGGAPAGPPPTPRAAAPVDLTGYWVSLVTEDWRSRMTLPPKGDAESVPLSPEGKKAAQAWDPAKDESAGEQCKAYGAAAIVRRPGRIHVTWQDDNTLKAEFDAGTQTRIFHFGSPEGKAGGWQGVSVASWDVPGTIMVRGGFGMGAGGGVDRGGALKVVTTGMKAGYLRKNGIPYSENATMTEYYDRFDIPNGDSLLMVSTEVTDPTYLTAPFWTSTHFKKQNDSTGWNPSACSSK
jgi:hypothetical protein